MLLGSRKLSQAQQLQLSANTPLKSNPMIVLRFIPRCRCPLSKLDSSRFHCVLAGIYPGFHPFFCFSSVWREREGALGGVKSSDCLKPLESWHWCIFRIVDPIWSLWYLWVVDTCEKVDILGFFVSQSSFIASTAENKVTRADYYILLLLLGVIINSYTASYIILYY